MRDASRPRERGKEIPLPQTGFRADDGFAFANSFTLSPDERARLAALVEAPLDGALAVLGPLGIAGRALGVRDRLVAIAARALPDRYGLCGGMAFASLDYLHAGVPLPASGEAVGQPASGSVLRAYLWQRLLDSWELNGATFLEWIARLHLVPARWPFDGGEAALRRRSLEQWRTLRRAIDAGTPVPIGLVGDAKDPFQDHQVVATGYEVRDTEHGVIEVYDMNCPGAVQTISVDFSTPALSAVESCARAGSPLRGFFVEAYVPKTPPADA